YQRGLVPLADAKESGRNAMAEISLAAPAGLALIDWDERNWLYARTAIEHNSIRSDIDSNMCSTATADMRWLLPLDLAQKAGLPTDRVFAVQPKDKFVVSDSPPPTQCNSHTGFEYRCQWSDVSLQRLDR
ncbi:MAG TPA: hypothetical protein VFM32_07970, partial [Spongiibacteraceae bacterium]|nr:hypothetical protein [Spongiibacteraceae bacterium]